MTHIYRDDAITRPTGRDDLTAIRDWIDAMQVRPVIDRTFDGLDQAANVLRNLGDGDARGKILVRVAADGRG